jgi:hypothetical protein
MRRVLRILLGAATAASLLLFLAAAAAWGRSYWRADHVIFDAGGRSFFVSAIGQTIDVQWTNRPYYRPLPWSSAPANSAASWADFFQPRHKADTARMGRPEEYRWLGFHVSPTFRQAIGDPTYDCEFAEVGVPYYFVCGLAALLPAARARRLLRRGRRRASGLCRTCWYDLRATPERCPECGLAPTGVPS